MENHFDSSPPTSAKQGAMAGFDAEFTDITDYILRITHRIWEGKQVGLCHDYYSDDCPVYTLAGVSIGAAEVVQNTLNTLAAFPDRTLHTDAIIWDGDDQAGYHTSHRITTRMTNTGDSDMGAATGKQAVIAVIAHCIVKNNRIIMEWLVRDNYALAQQLGFDPRAVAQRKAFMPEDDRFTKWRSSEIERVLRSVNTTRAKTPPDAQKNPAAFILATLQNIWNARMVGDVRQAYAENASLHTSANRKLSGHEAITQFYIRLLSTLSNLKLSVDHICQQPGADGGVDVAARWTLVGKHTGATLYGAPTAAPVLILGESHYHIIAGVIQEEWMVFDELSVWEQIYRARAASGQGEQAVQA